jgi:hypothetical protein
MPHKLAMSEDDETALKGDIIDFCNVLLDNVLSLLICLMDLGVVNSRLEFE